MLKIRFCSFVAGPYVSCSFGSDFQTNRKEKEINNHAFWKLYSLSKTEIVILAKIINNLPTAGFSSPEGDSESSSKFLHHLNKRTIV